MRINLQFGAGLVSGLVQGCCSLVSAAARALRGFKYTSANSGVLCKPTFYGEDLYGTLWRHPERVAGQTGSLTRRGAFKAAVIRQNIAIA